MELVYEVASFTVNLASNELEYVSDKIGVGNVMNGQVLLLGLQQVFDAWEWSWIGMDQNVVVVRCLSMQHNFGGWGMEGVLGRMFIISVHCHWQQKPDKGWVQFFQCWRGITVVCLGSESSLVNVSTINLD